MRPALGVRYAELAPDAVLTCAQVADWLQLTPRQVQRLGIPFIDCGRRSRRYLVADVRAWIEARRALQTSALRRPA